jgi:hypothetical protein
MLSGEFKELIILSKAGLALIVAAVAFRFTYSTQRRVINADSDVASAPNPVAGSSP